MRSVMVSYLYSSEFNCLGPLRLCLPFVRVIDGLETDVFLVLEEPWFKVS